ncbi:MAG: hypothetical protein NT126_09600 [Bacteroidetes bacterium]|nr:hypothetical protein [Bacteroidota bacterium]
MSDQKNINDLTPEESWQKAEEMLDRHFMKKGIVRWSLWILVSGLILFGSYELVSRLSNGNSSGDKQIANHPAHVSIEKPVSNPSNGNSSPAIPSNDQNKIQRNHQADVREKSSAPVVSRDEKINSVSKNNTANLSAPKKIEKKNNQPEMLTADPLIHDANPDLNNQPKAKTGNDKSFAGHETKSQPQPSVSGSLQQEGVDEKKSAGISENIFPALTGMMPIKNSGVLFASKDLSISDSRKEVKLPSQKCGINLLVYASSNYVTKTLDSKTYKEYITRRKNEEEGIVMPSMGALLSLESHHFSFGAGLECSVWGENLKYLPLSMQKNVVENGNWQTYYRTGYDSSFNYYYGNQFLHVDTVQVLDSTFSSHIDTVIQQGSNSNISSVNRVNRYCYLGIPLEISYRFTGSKIGIGATIGISPAWLISSKGYYVTRDLTGVESIAEIPSLNKFMVNGRVSIDLYYRFNDRIHFVLRPQVRTNLASVFKEDFDVKQKYYSTGLSFGLQYSLR